MQTQITEVFVDNFPLDFQFQTIDSIIIHTQYKVLCIYKSFSFSESDRRFLKKKWERCRNTFFQDPSELILEGWIFHFEFFDEVFRVNRIIVLAPPASRDPGQCGTDSLSIRVIMQGQHYFPSSFLVTGLLPLLSIFYEITSPRKFDHLDYSVKRSSW